MQIKPSGVVDVCVGGDFTKCSLSFLFLLLCRRGGGPPAALSDSKSIENKESHLWMEIWTQRGSFSLCVRQYSLHGAGWLLHPETL